MRSVLTGAGLPRHSFARTEEGTWSRWLGCASAILRALAIAAVATPAILFWVVLFAADPASPVTIAISPGLGPLAGLVFFLAATAAFLTGPSPSAIVDAEVERLHNVLLAKDMALDALGARQRLG